MLNEIIEAQEYLRDISSGRIKWQVLFNKYELNGLSRCMTVIARYFLFLNKDDSNDDITETDVLRAEAAVRMWCGLRNESITDEKYKNIRNNKKEKYRKLGEDTPDLSDHYKRAEEYYRNLVEYNERLETQYSLLEHDYSWLNFLLQDYLRDSVSNAKEADMAKVEKGLEKISEKYSQFALDSYVVDPAFNDFKMIKFDKIIANALVSGGALKKYYMAAKTPDWDVQLRVRQKNGNYKGLVPSQKEKIKKILAAYLLERNRKDARRHDEELRYEPVNLKEVSFWADGTSPIEGKHLKPFYVNEKPLFSLEPGAPKNATKVKPDPEWFKACGWTLIEATEDDDELYRFLDNNPEGIYYSDIGANKDLILDKRY